MREGNLILVLEKGSLNQQDLVINKGRPKDPASFYMTIRAYYCLFLIVRIVPIQL